MGSPSRWLITRSVVLWNFFVLTLCPSRTRYPHGVEHGTEHGRECMLGGVPVGGEGRDGTKFLIAKKKLAKRNVDEPGDCYCTW